MKHKHAEMIKAKADNMDLVVFLNTGLEWIESFFETLVANQHLDYFLCLPQHKDACLHWLNGGKVQQSNLDDIERWIESGGNRVWMPYHSFMQSKLEFRIKPRKEKRWIGYCANTNQTFPHPQKTIEIAEDYAARNYGYKMSDWKFIEIEVEV